MKTEHLGRITGLAHAYLNGVYRGDTVALAALFEPDAQVYGEIDGLPYHKTVAAYLEGVAARQSPLQLGEPYRMHILAIDSLGSIASVKLHAPMLGLNYQLFLTLRQLEGAWRIVNKTFSHIEAG